MKRKKRSELPLLKHSDSAPEMNLSWGLEETEPVTPKKSKKSSKAMAKKSKSKPDESDEFNFSFEDPEPEPKTKTGRRGDRYINVKLAYNSVGLDQSDFFMEVAAMRGTIPDWDLERWSQYLHSVGNVPFYIACGDVDRFHMLVYASEILRKNPDYKDAGIAELSRLRAAYDPKKEDEKIGGRVWGEVEALPVREQMKAKQEAHIEENRSEAAPAEVALSREGAETAFEAKWVTAAKYARAKRDTWEGKVDFELEQMIKYCYGWLRDIGEIPEPFPTEPIDLFWPRPTSAMIKQDEITVQRREYISYKVMKLWRKTMADPESHVDPSLFTYRAVLAAKGLSKAIENYAVNHQTDPEGVNDEELRKRVGKHALKYIKAHNPVQYEGASRGPDWVVDPDYVTYLQICQKYNIKVGTLLHESSQTL